MGVEKKSICGSFRIIDLAKNCFQIFGFKGLAGKIFQNQRLRLSKSTENGFGAASRCVLVDGRNSKLPQSKFYYRARWVVSQ